MRYNLFLIAALCVLPACARASDFYVAPTGVDTGTCTSQSSPCATIGYATKQALSSPANGVATIHMGAGGWNESVAVTGSPPGSGLTGSNVRLIYDGAGSSTVWNGQPGLCGTLIANSGADIGIENMTIEAEGDKCQSALFAQLGGIIQVYGGVTFGPAWQQQMHAEGSGSQIEIWDDLTVSGGINTFMGAISNALIEINPTNVTVTINNTPSFSGAFLNAAVNGTIYVAHTTKFAGGVNGQSYIASMNGSIFTDGVGCSSLPGSGGTASSGGVCQ